MIDYQLINQMSLKGFVPVLFMTLVVVNRAVCVQQPGGERLMPTLVLLVQPGCLQAYRSRLGNSLVHSM